MAREEDEHFLSLLSNSTFDTPLLSLLLTALLGLAWNFVYWGHDARRKTEMEMGMENDMEGVKEKIGILFLFPSFFLSFPSLSGLLSIPVFCLLSQLDHKEREVGVEDGGGMESDVSGDA